MHDAVVIIISDFDGADDETRKMVGAMARHNDVVALLVHDPLQSDLPASASMTVTDGELQIHLEVGRESVRKSISQASQERLKGVLAWTQELGVPVLPLSAAEDTAQQLRRLLGALPSRGGRGGAMVRWGRALADAQTRQADPLAGLIDIPLPPEVSLWPQTWPLRIAIVLIAAGWPSWRSGGSCIAIAPTGTGARRCPNWIGCARTPDAAPDRLADRDFAVLVRRTALGAFPRETIAPLAGPAWLAFLDRSYGGQEFSRGAGRLARQRALSTDLAGSRSSSMRCAASSVAGSGCTMFEFAWPWMLALLPLPILAWWLLPPYRARQASVQVPFFDRLAAATGQTPQRGAVVLQRRRDSDDRRDR